MYGYGLDVSFDTGESYTPPTRATGYLALSGARRSTRSGRALSAAASRPAGVTFATTTGGSWAVTPSTGGLFGLADAPGRASTGPSVMPSGPSASTLVADDATRTLPELPSFVRPPAVTGSEARYPDVSAPMFAAPSLETGIGAWIRRMFAPRVVTPLPRSVYPTPRGGYVPRPGYAPRPGYPLPRGYAPRGYTPRGYAPGGYVPLVAGDLFAPGVYGPGEASAADASAADTDATVETAALAAPAAETPWLLYAGVGLAVAGGVYYWRKKQKKG